jgi:hypothetical protein
LPLCYLLLALAVKSGLVAVDSGHKKLLSLGFVEDGRAFANVSVWGAGVATEASVIKNRI